MQTSISTSLHASKKAYIAGAILISLVGIATILGSSSVRALLTTRGEYQLCVRDAVYARDHAYIASFHLYAAQTEAVLVKRRDDFYEALGMTNAQLRTEKIRTSISEFKLAYPAAQETYKAAKIAAKRAYNDAIAACKNAKTQAEGGGNSNQNISQHSQQSSVGSSAQSSTVTQRQIASVEIALPATNYIFDGSDTEVTWTTSGFSEVTNGTTSPAPTFWIYLYDENTNSNKLLFKDPSAPPNGSHMFTMKVVMNEIECRTEVSQLGGSSNDCPITPSSSSSNASAASRPPYPTFIVTNGNEVIVSDVDNFRENEDNEKDKIYVYDTMSGIGWLSEGFHVNLPDNTGGSRSSVASQTSSIASSTTPLGTISVVRPTSSHTLGTTQSSIDFSTSNIDVSRSRFSIDLYDPTSNTYTYLFTHTPQSSATAMSIPIQLITSKEDCERIPTSYNLPPASCPTSAAVYPIIRIAVTPNQSIVKSVPSMVDGRRYALRIKELVSGRPSSQTNGHNWSGGIFSGAQATGTQFVADLHTEPVYPVSSTACWETIELPDFGEILSQTTFNGKIVVLGKKEGQSVYMYTTTDGLSWTEMQTDLPYVHGMMIAHQGKLWYFDSHFDSMFNRPTEWNVWTSEQGRTWKGYRKTPVDDWPNNTRLYDIAVYDDAIHLYTLKSSRVYTIKVLGVNEATNHVEIRLVGGAIFEPAMSHIRFAQTEGKKWLMGKRINMIDQNAIPALYNTEGGDVFVNGNSTRSNMPESGSPVGFEGKVYRLGGEYGVRSGQAHREVMQSSDGISWIESAFPLPRPASPRGYEHNGSIWAFDGDLLFKSNLSSCSYSTAIEQATIRNKDISDCRDHTTGYENLTASMTTNHSNLLYANGKRFISPGILRKIGDTVYDFSQQYGPLLYTGTEWKKTGLDTFANGDEVIGMTAYQGGEYAITKIGALLKREGDAFPSMVAKLSIDPITEKVIGLTTYNGSLVAVTKKNVYKLEDDTFVQWFAMTDGVQDWNINEFVYGTDTALYISVGRAVFKYQNGTWSDTNLAASRTNAYVNFMYEDQGKLIATVRVSSDSIGYHWTHYSYDGSSWLYLGNFQLVEDGIAFWRMLDGSSSPQSCRYIGSTNQSPIIPDNTETIYSTSNPAPAEALPPNTSLDPSEITRSTATSFGDFCAETTDWAAVGLESTPLNNPIYLGDTLYGLPNPPSGESTSTLYMYTYNRGTLNRQVVEFDTLNGFGKLFTKDGRMFFVASSQRGMQRYQYITGLSTANAMDVYPDVFEVFPNGTVQYLGSLAKKAAYQNPQDTVLDVAIVNGVLHVITDAGDVVAVHDGTSEVIVHDDRFINSVSLYNFSKITSIGNTFYVSVNEKLYTFQSGVVSEIASMQQDGNSIKIDHMVTFNNALYFTNKNNVYTLNAAGQPVSTGFDIVAPLQPGTNWVSYVSSLEVTPRGLVAQDTTTGTYFVYNGSSWSQLSTDNFFTGATVPGLTVMANREYEEGFVHGIRHNYRHHTVYEFVCKAL